MNRGPRKSRADLARDSVTQSTASDRVLVSRARCRSATSGFWRKKEFYPADIDIAFDPDIIGKGNTVVTFESKVNISGNSNSLFDAVLSSVYISGHGNFGQMVNTVLELSGNGNSLTGLVGCSIVVTANRVTVADTCTVP